MPVSKILENEQDWAVATQETTTVSKPLSSRDRPTQKRLADSSALATSPLTLLPDSLVSIFVTDGPAKGLEYNLTRPLVTVGRHGGMADIRLGDSLVSRLHCSIEVKRDVMVLRDLRSTNGTYVGEERVLGAQLKHDSEFRVGSSTLRIAISTNIDQTSIPS
jgi:hypothetical protein